MYKNVADQLIPIYAHDTALDQPKTGDAANITAQISKDGAASAATGETNPTELDATDHPGVYLFSLTQAEGNADLVILTASSSTSNVSIEPGFIYTKPQLAAIGAGTGATTFTYTLTSDVDASPTPDACVWVTSDAGGTTTIASGRSPSTSTPAPSTSGAKKPAGTSPTPTRRQYLSHVIPRSEATKESPTTPRGRHHGLHSSNS